MEAAYAASGKAMIRDSRHPDHGHLAFPAAAWHAFLHAARTGDL